jgi:GNAT superfamily N-acetyltransferase
MNVIDSTRPHAAPHRVPLSRDRWVTIRPIESSDADGLADFYARLSPEARVARFLAGSNGIRTEAAQRFARVDHAGAEGIVGILHEPGPGDGAIVGHLCLEPDGSGGAEVAIAVADGFRGRGIGSALMASGVAWARHHKVAHLTAFLFPTNRPMRKLMLDAGPHIGIDRIDAGIEEIELDLGYRRAARRTSHACPGRA